MHKFTPDVLPVITLSLLTLSIMWNSWSVVSLLKSPTSITGQSQNKICPCHLTAKQAIIQQSLIDDDDDDVMIE